MHNSRDTADQNNCPIGKQTAEHKFAFLLITSVSKEQTRVWWWGFWRAATYNRAITATAVGCGGGDKWSLGCGGAFDKWAYARVSARGANSDRCLRLDALLCFAAHSWLSVSVIAVGARASINNRIHSLSSRNSRRIGKLWSFQLTCLWRLSLAGRAPKVNTRRWACTRRSHSLAFLIHCHSRHRIVYFRYCPWPRRFDCPSSLILIDTYAKSKSRFQPKLINAVVTA